VTLAYGSAPDLAVVAQTAVLYLAVPALYIAFGLLAGTVIASQAGVAGLGMLLMMVPALAGSFLPPAVMQALPMVIGSWVAAFVAGAPVPASTPIAWGIAMAAIPLAAIVLFRRQEL
jgi:hypothetical protein